MPPPITTVSAVLIRLAITASLSDTLAPPRTTTYGRAGSSASCFSTSTSARTSPPAAFGSRCATSYTLACLRCTTPKPSETKTSASAAYLSASAPRSASSLDSSPGSYRTFSSMATRPSSSAPTTASADSPTTSAASVTGAPSSSDSLVATGLSEYFGLTWPFGRPRWAMTMILAPASRSWSRVGSEARIRPSSVIVSPSSGTFRSQRISTRLPRRSPRSATDFTSWSFRQPPRPRSFHRKPALSIGSFLWNRPVSHATWETDSPGRWGGGVEREV